MRKLATLSGMLLVSAAVSFLGCTPDVQPGPLSMTSPIVSALSPAAGPSDGGIELTLDGENFLPGAKVSIDGIEATQVSVASANRIKALLPARPGRLGRVEVAVTNPDGQLGNRNDLFSYYASRVSFTHAMHGAGHGARSLVIADFNSDQKLDFAVGTAPAGFVNVLIGDGRGGISATTSLSVSPSPAQLAAADFNQDGKVDLVSGLKGKTGVMMASGMGAIGFERVDIIDVESAQDTMTVGDFNGDQSPDLVITDSSRQKDNVSVLLGDGRGRFGSPNKLTAVGYPVGVIVGDFNSDGKADLIVADRTGLLNMHLGDGLGGFGGAREQATESPAASIAAADFNQDGKPDIALTNFANSQVTVLLGDGRGSYLSINQFPTGAQPQVMAISDYNVDGNLDLAVVRSDGNLSVLMGNGLGGFGTPKSFPISTQAVAVATGDWNGDQRPDLAVVSDTNPGVNSLTLLLNESL